MKTQRISLSLILFLSSLTSISLGTDDWKSFQNGGQLSFESKDAKVPMTWDADKGIQWSIQLDGYGQSSPVVVGNRVYLTTVTGDMKQNYQLMAINLENGKTEWQKEFKNSSPEKSSSYVSRAAPSPVCDSDGVIAFFEGGNLIALTTTGEERWSLDLVDKYGAIKARHGLASSLEQNQDHVFVWVERQEDPYVMAIKKKDGSVAWKSPGLGVTSWSSPRLVPVGEKQHLVISGIGKIAGYDPVNGKQLWTFDDLSGNSTPTPVPVGSGQFLIGASSGRGEQTSGKAAKSNGLIQIKEENGEFKAEFVWQAEQATCTFGSPLAYNNNAYFVNRSGVLFCLDLKTGKQKYAGRVKSSIWATPIGVGSEVFLFGKDGITTVVDAGDSFQKKATNVLWKSEKREQEGAGQFGGPVLYSGIVVGNRLLLRRGDRLYCIGS